MNIINLSNNKIKHIIIGNKKTIQPKKQSSMTTKQFQDYVIQFIQEQKLVNQRQEETNKKQEIFNQQQLEFNKKQEKFNEMILERLDKIESCPTIQKEINSK